MARRADEIAAPVRASIAAELAAVADEQNVTILFACESGSRAWGFASPDSDYDVRFVYAHRLDWYLRVEPGRDVIELPIADDLDINGWDLRKALHLLHRSNPSLLEWLVSPLVYHEVTDVADELRRLAGTHFSSAAAEHHYLSMAGRNATYVSRETVRHKKYFYVLRPLLAARWVRRHSSQPPMRFDELLAATLDPRTEAPVLAEVAALLAVKTATGEAVSGPRLPALDAFIREELQRPATWSDAARLRPTASLDDFLLRTVLRFDPSADRR